MQYLLSQAVRYHRIVAASFAVLGFATLYICARTFGMDLHFGFVTDHEIRPLIHFCTYGTLAVVLHAALRRNIWLSWGIALTLAWGEEFHQLVVPGRYFTLDDLAVNFLGVTIFLLLTHKLRLIHRAGRMLHNFKAQQMATA